MADFRRGIKAGMAAAAVYLIIALILGTIGYKSWYLWQFIYAAGLGTAFGLTVSSFIHELLFQYVVRGIIFGAVFTVLYDYLPGVTSIVKGVVLSSFLWIVTVVNVMYLTPGWPWAAHSNEFVGTHYGGIVSLASPSLALAGIISTLVFGTLTGLLWDRLRGKELTEERKGRPVLLVSFIMGGVTWTVLTVLFLTGVLTSGGPVIEPGPFWWESILFVSVVFLGLPGWVLALDAWRKTRMGEAGFKWGVAGGVIMALTGIMLLPGLLAIIGGVLSRRNPATEPSAVTIEK